LYIGQFLISEEFAWNFWEFQFFLGIESGIFHGSMGFFSELFTCQVEKAGHLSSATCVHGLSGLICDSSADCGGD
jgi:hypothetical protein